MNGKDPPPSGGQQPGVQSGFGKLKNQGRGSYGEKTESSTGPQGMQPMANVGRSRSNAVLGQSDTDPTVGRGRSNAVFQPPTGFSRIKNEGRSSSQQPPERPGAKTGSMQNLGRNAYQSASDNRENLSPKQQVGFDLVSGFMKHLIDKADKGAQTDDGNSSKRAQQGTGNQFNQQEEEDKRRLSIQSSQRGGDDEDISAGEFFKRLSSAMADPAKFKQEAAQRAKSRQQQSGSTNTNSGQQQRERSNAIGADNRQTATKDLFKSMQGILTDPAGFKRRMESQKNIQQGVKSQPNGPQPNGPQPSEQLPKTDTSTQHSEPKRAQTGSSQEPKKQLARKTNPPVLPKSSPRKSR